jgi:hypothetical protein
VNKLRFCLVLMVLTLSTIGFAKDLPPSERVAREPEKRQQSNAEPAIDAARYLRWHRDAMALRGRPEGANPSTRAPYLQL